MKAVGLYKHLPIEDTQSLVDLDIQQPQHPTGHDLLVSIKAISVNPLDTKVRRGTIPPPENENMPRILGWDAAGEVIAVGSDCTLFENGDAIYYVGSISRPGTNCEFHLVDERIVGRKPKSLSFEEAAAMPLTTITAWEALYDRLSLYSDTIRSNTVPPLSSNDSDKMRRHSPSSILIIGGAGGVGSITIQLAKNLVNDLSSSSSFSGINVIATAYRNESVEWCKKIGAGYVINHHKDLKSQIKEIGIDYGDYILCLNNTDGHFDSMKRLIAPQGKICSIVETKAPVDIGGMLQQKSATFVWELMFTRSLFQTYDMIEQHHLLNTVADLIDRKKIKTTLKDLFTPINAENLRKAHKKLNLVLRLGRLLYLASKRNFAFQSQKSVSISFFIA
jgi:zinc-binding alcohol dehydrogenase family protein